MTYSWHTHDLRMVAQSNFDADKSLMKWLLLSEKEGDKVNSSNKSTSKGTCYMFKRNRKEKGYLTSAEVGKIVGAAPRTVNKWFDSGMISGYRLPGSTDRRFYSDDVFRFLCDNGMKRCIADHRRAIGQSILIVSEDSRLFSLFNDALDRPVLDSWQLDLASDVFTTARLSGRHPFAYAFLDSSLGRECIAAVAYPLKWEGTTLIGINSSMCNLSDFIFDGLDHVLCAPFGPPEIRTFLESITAHKGKTLQHATKREE